MSENNESRYNPRQIHASPKAVNASFRAHLDTTTEIGARVCNPQQRAKVEGVEILPLLSCERAADCKSAVRPISGIGTLMVVVWGGCIKMRPIVPKRQMHRRFG